MLDVRRREFIALAGGGCLLLAARVRRARVPKAALHRSIRQANWAQTRRAVAICTMVH